jgi:hypothetical protein
MKPIQLETIERKHLGKYFIDPATGFKFRLWKIEKTLNSVFEFGNHERHKEDVLFSFRPEGVNTRLMDETIEVIQEEYPDEYYFDEIRRLFVRTEYPYDFFMVDKDFRYEHGHFCIACGEACDVTADLESSCCGDVICTSSLLNEETDRNELREYLEEERRTPCKEV